MDTSRRPDGPIDSRADRQLRQPQGLQLMKWILSWIQSRPLRWLPSPRAIIDTADASRSSGCTSAGAPGWRVQGSPIEGGGARPLGGLVHQAGAAAGHPEPTDRGLGAVPDTQPGPTSAFAKPSIPSCPHRPSSRTSSWRNRRPASGYGQTRTRSGSLKSLDVSVSTGRKPPQGPRQ